MDYLRGIDIQARIRFFDEKDHYEMCREALDWCKRKPSFEPYQVHWRSARACFKYYGFLIRSKFNIEASKILIEMLHHSKETLKKSDCHPMGRKYKAIALWLFAKKANDDASELELLVECKKLLDEAIETLPNDHELRQYRGLWHYKVSSLNALDRLAAIFLKGLTVPKSTIEDALADLKIADQAHQLEVGRKNFRTLLLIGLCYLSKRMMADAKTCYETCLILPMVEHSVDGDTMEDELNSLREGIETISDYSD